LTKADFNAADAPVGPQGPKGADGTADAFARVQANGTLEGGISAPGGPSQNKGVVAANVVHPAVGVYCFAIDGDPASAMVAFDNAGTAVTAANFVASVAIQRGNNLGGCPATHQDARVFISKGDTAAATDERFFIWFEK
jgi:hypothetical protein